MTPSRLNRIAQQANAMSQGGMSDISVMGRETVSGSVIGTLNVRVERVGTNIPGALPFVLGSFLGKSDGYSKVIQTDLNFLGVIDENSPQNQIPEGLRIPFATLRNKVAFVYLNAAGDAIDYVLISSNGDASYPAFLASLAASTLKTSTGVPKSPGIKLITPTDSDGQVNQEMVLVTASALGAAKRQQLDVGGQIQASQNLPNVLEVDKCVPFGFRSGLLSSVQASAATAYTYYFNFSMISQPES